MTLSKIRLSLTFLIRNYLIMFSVVLGLYVTNRYADALINPKPLYAEMDDEALAKIAQEEWAAVSENPIPYIVSFGGQHGRQVAGSVALNLPYRVRILENNDPTASPWIDVADLKRRGALILAPHGVPHDTSIAGRSIDYIVRIDRPMLRGARYPYIFEIGVLYPIK